MNDNYDFYSQSQIDFVNKIKHLPKCKYCEEHILTEKAVTYNGKWVCNNCEQYLWFDIREDFLKEVRE